MKLLYSNFSKDHLFLSNFSKRINWLLYLRKHTITICSWATTHQVHYFSYTRTHQLCDNRWGSSALICDKPSTYVPVPFVIYLLRGFALAESPFYSGVITFSLFLEILPTSMSLMSLIFKTNKQRPWFQTIYYPHFFLSFLSKTPWKMFYMYLVFPLHYLLYFPQSSSNQAYIAIASVI